MSQLPPVLSIDVTYYDIGVKKKIVDSAKSACLEHHMEQLVGRCGNSLQYLQSIDVTYFEFRCEEEDS